MVAEFKELMVSLQKTAYHQWMKKEGIPVVVNYGVEDIRELELRPWPRMGGRGTFIHLYGMEGATGMYVGEIPSGGALQPEKHLYDEVVCILAGNGATEVWQENGKKQLFEWGPWSLFAPPKNSWHRLINGGREPVKFVAVTDAPSLMDVFRNEEFIFRCPFVFSERFSGEEGYYNVSNKRYKSGLTNIWETNFIPDVRSALLAEKRGKGEGEKVSGGNSIVFQIAGNYLAGHIGQWPVGRYHKAHYHGPGAILLGLGSVGSALMWPKELGNRPYESGHGDKVAEVKWKEGSVYSPPDGWFHQHFNTGALPARLLAFRSSRLYPTGRNLAAKRHDDGAITSIKKGGTMIEYEDEDPEIRRRFESELKKKGIRCEMPPIFEAVS
jgi:oxalate decarboxylase/phosphoglucose isomerase-like protein (cupin superfamily)